MRLSILLLCLLALSPARGQYSNLNWCLGDSAGIKFSNSGIDSMYRTTVKARGTCAAISDSLGNLIFYGSSPSLSNYLSGQNRQGKLFSGTHQGIVNGDSLMTTQWYREMLIIPNPGQPSQYYVFTAGVTPTTNPGLRYTLVDMSLNNGLGYVLQKNVLVDANQVTDGITAIQHGNGRDWWVVYKTWEYYSNAYKVALISSNGLGQVDTQFIGYPSDRGFHRLIPNRNGNRLASINNQGLLEIFEFDRCTGTLYSPLLILDSTSVWPNSFWDGAFSASGRYFYTVSWDTLGHLFQYDLSLPDSLIFNQRVLIDTMDRGLNVFSSLRLGPDFRIYHSEWWIDQFSWGYPYPDTLYEPTNTHLSVINSPDSFGLDCDYQRLAVYLGGARTYVGLPNDVYYDLGPLAGSPCDSLTVGVQEPVYAAPELQLNAWWHSDWERLIINASGLKKSKALLRVYDLQGRLLLQQEVSTMPPYLYYELNAATLSDGVYIVELREGNQTKAVKWVKR